MRIAIAVLFVAVLAILAFCTSVTTPGASKAFASTPVTNQVWSANPCARYCNGAINNKFCGSSPNSQGGCVSASGDECVFTLCSN